MSSRQILANAKRHNLAMTDTATGKPFDPDRRASRREVLGPYRSKTELLYAQHLNLLLAAGEIDDWVYEPCRFDLTTGLRHPDGEPLDRSHCYYRPDFQVTVDQRVEFFEVKGRWRTADRQRWRTAAGQHPEYRWRAVQRVKGQWVYEEFAG